MMLIDGARALCMALCNGFPVAAVYVAPAAADKQADLLRKTQDAGGRVQAVTPAVFRKISYGDHPDGLLGVAPCPHVTLADLPAAGQPLYLVAEGLEKPGNLGAMLRSADAAGATALVLCDGRTDIWNPNVIRASQGGLFCCCPLRWRARRRRCCGCAAGRSRSLPRRRRRCGRTMRLICDRQAHWCWGPSTAGLTSVWRGETRVRIPMAGQVDSLNVAQTASILLFEAVRQRLGSGPDRPAT